MYYIFCFPFVFQYYTASDRDSTTTADSSDFGDAGVEVVADENLFSYRMPVGNVVLGFVIVATHDRNFGKLYLRITKGRYSVNLRHFTEFVQLLRLPLEEKKAMVGINGTIGVHDASVRFSRRDGSMTIFHNSPTFEGECDFVTLTTAEQDQIKARHHEVFGGKVLFFEMLEKVTSEAIIDIKTECRMYAQGHCKGCKEVDTNLQIHTCTNLIGFRLERVLHEAMMVHDKWPYSNAIQEIYSRLRGHGIYFREEFRHSMEWNKHMNVAYKTADLPAYVIRG
jgi:hypothetical protein